MQNIRKARRLPRILHDREYWDWPKKTDTGSHQQRTTRYLSLGNETQCSQSMHLCVVHSWRPSTQSAPSRVSPRCRWIQIPPTYSTSKTSEHDTIPYGRAYAHYCTTQRNKKMLAGNYGENRGRSIHIPARIEVRIFYLQNPICCLP